MFLKGVVIVAIFGFCRSAEHAYSSQSIVLHHEHKENNDHKNEYHEPIEVEVQKAVPIVEYVVESSGYDHKKEYKHEDQHVHKDEPKYERGNHQHAFSTQHIVHHHEHKGHDDHKEEYHIPVKVEAQKDIPTVEEPKYEHHDNQHDFLTQHYVQHHEHKGHDDHKEGHNVPVNVEVHEVPIVEYVAESFGNHKEEYNQENQHVYNVEPKHEQIEQHNHKHAFSSQHIERHDIPAHPPKGWNEHHGPAKYEFEYKIHDPHTHDNKYQHEARDGHRVKGVYSLHEADGSVRTVEYTADKKTGFQADVKHTTKHVEEHKPHH